jgi:hypothetical protein
MTEDEEGNTPDGAYLLDHRLLCSVITELRTERTKRWENRVREQRGAGKME